MWTRGIRTRNDNISVMTLEESRRTQRPYRYGMILLCFGALANWLGLAENYSDPIRYLGVACIIAGALLICTAMCCWLHTPPRTADDVRNYRELELSPSQPTDRTYVFFSLLQHSPDPSVHVIGGVSDENRREKPPDYDTVAIAPPSYDDAIKLTPAVFLHPPQTTQTLTQTERPSTPEVNSTTPPVASTSANQEVAITIPSASATDSVTR
ncbi:uncharacterized protein LOC129792455 isoform X1 [Lutzomyia longipalpis]|uniref:uncharacterized protein LOC129792455 isoform X1 n=1 Tax=Lutzomyia longipalpis TaxID=7200 RepID=UPI002483376B|nr:uncharacterized protein LOC129792455 isoform X1 [Lutzomyia longipalpis]